MTAKVQGPADTSSEDSDDDMYMSLPENDSDTEPPVSHYAHTYGSLAELGTSELILKYFSQSLPPKGRFKIPVVHRVPMPPRGKVILLVRNPKS
jgi:hypothetical protein